MNETDKQRALVRVVDDDADVREAVSFLLECDDWKVVTYDCAEAFLKDLQTDKQGCALVDIRMTGISGLELQKCLKEMQFRIPLIFLTGHGTVDSAVQALKNGAFDFLQKPVREEVLLEVVNQACELSLFTSLGGLTEPEIKRLALELSPRERELLRFLKDGLENLEIAERLNLSSRTVQGHRNNLYKKLRVHSRKELLEEIEKFKRYGLEI